VYGLAETIQAHNLVELSAVLLELLAAEVPSEQRTHIYRRVASALITAGWSAANGREKLNLKGQAVEPDRATNLTQRLAASVQRLNQMNYQARWEAHARGPRLILEHCPYAAILKSHPEMCQIDRHLLQELSGATVVQTECLALDERGAPFCRFALQTR
jgi:hypothetical protein